MCELAVQVEIKRVVLGSVLLVLHRPRRCEIRRQVREDSKANYTMVETPSAFGLKGRNTFLTSLRSSKFSLLTIQIQTTWNYVAFTCPSLNSKKKENGIIRKVSPLVAIHKHVMIHRFYSRKTMPLEITVGAMQGYMIHLRPMSLGLGIITHVNPFPW